MQCPLASPEPLGHMPLDFQQFIFYSAMHFNAKRSIAMVILSVCYISDR